MPPETINQTIGNNIRLRRHLEGMTQHELAMRLGISFQQVQKYERGLNSASPERLVRLAEIFACAVENFFHAPEAFSPRHPPCFASVRHSKKIVRMLQNFEYIESGEIRDRLCGLIESIAMAKPLQTLFTAPSSTLPRHRLNLL